MSSYNTSTGEIVTNVNTDNLLSSILSNFNTEYITDIVRDSINMRFRPYNIGMPGLNAFEQNFQNIMNGLEDYSQKQQTMQVREDTYNEIISIICQYYDLTYNPNEDIDTYAVAYYLYDLLVSNFSATIINFFTNFIVRNQEELYKQIAPNITKDMTNNYSKKMYSNSHLGIIHSFLSTVMDNIAVMDIKLQDILNYAVTDLNEINIIMYTITDNNDIFKNHFAIYLSNSSTRSDLITCVKLALQQYATSDLAASIGESIVRKDKE